LARTAAAIDEEALQAVRKRFRASQFMRFVLLPLSLSILVLGLLVGMLALLTGITRDERWSSLTILLFIVALEAIYTTNWLRHPDRLQLDRTAYRGAELLLILIIVRLVSWIIFEEGVPDAVQLQLFLGNPLILFLNGPFLVSLLLTVIAWRLAVILGTIFKDLEVSEFELRFYSLPLAQRKAIGEDQPIQAGRRQLVRNFARYWIWGGILLAATVGLSRLDLRSIDSFKSPLAMGGLDFEPKHLAILLLYFGIGFWLLSQAKLMEMNARWMVNGISKDDQMERNWQRSSLLILLLVGLIAAFIPIGPSLAISRILGAAIYILLFFVNLLILLLTLPVALILAFLSRRPIGELEPPLQITPEALTESTQPTFSTLGEMIVMVFSSAFWSIFIVILVLALVFFLRERKSSIQGKSATSIRQQFLLWLSDLWQRLRLRARTIRIQLPVQVVREDKGENGAEAKKGWRFIRLGGLSPREKIRYFYLSTVRRAGERGVPRDSAETPLEFAEDLKDGWPEVEEEVEELTDAFLKARYSDDPVVSEDVPEVKETWKDVRRQIRKRPSPVDRAPDEASDSE
jgi:hypothetical protein